jgi:hypothetical protein
MSFGSDRPFDARSRANRKEAGVGDGGAPARAEKGALISGDSIMQNLIRTAVLLALLGSRTTIAQTIGSARSSAGSAIATTASSLTQNTWSIGGAPVGHRQPHAPDILSQNASDLEHIGEEDAAVDRKLNICRGC